MFNPILTPPPREQVYLCHDFTSKLTFNELISKEFPLYILNNPNSPGNSNIKRAPG